MKKNNDPNSMKCRACRDEIETQQHILEECLRLHTSEETKTKEIEYFSEETTILKNAAKKIKNTIERLEKYKK